jgi:dienelactone hydrolase
MKFLRKSVSSFLVLLLAGCTVYQPLRKTPASSELPEFYHHYYDYPKMEFKAETLSETVTHSYVLKQIQFPLSFPEDLQMKDLNAFRAANEELAKTDQKTAEDQKLRYMNRVDLYLPKNRKPGEKRPVILISPILGGNMVVDRFARYYAGRGYIAALVYRKRVFWDDEDEYPQQLEKYMRFSVIRLRQAIDWLETQPEVDSKRIGAFGVSYGAILHTVLAAVEPRIRYHVLAMPAGNLAELIEVCPEKSLRKLERHALEKYGCSKETLYADLKKSLKTDPIYLAPYIDRSKVQIYVALFDRVVGAKRSWALWRALGKPKVRVMPFGHYGGVLIFPYLQTQSYLAFKRHLK